MSLLLLDWNRTLYNPDTKKLYNDTLPFLKKLQKKSCVVIILSTGKIADAYNEKNIVMPFVKKFIIGVKNQNKFTLVNKGTSLEKVIVIGDSLSQEIRIANELGYTSVRLLRGKFQYQLPENIYEVPDYSIRSLQKIFSLPLSF